MAQSSTTIAGNRLLAGIAVLSLTAISQQIVLTRLFSVVLRFHFAFIAVSSAMLGTALGGLLVYYLRRSGRDPAGIGSAALFAALFGWLQVILLWIVLGLEPEFDQGWRLVGKLGLIYLLVVMPFIAFGGAVAAVISGLPQLVHKLYAADLAGAAAAGLMVAVALVKADVPTVATIVAWLASFSAVLISRAGGPKRIRRWCLFSCYYLTFVMAMQVVSAGFFEPVFRLRWAKGFQDAEYYLDRWNLYSRVTVRPYSDKPFFWGASKALRERARQMTIGQRWLQIDSDAGTVVTEFDGKIWPLRYLRWDIVNIAHHLRKNARVFVAGAGGGRDILSALAFRQQRVVAAEINRAVFEVLTEDMADYTGRLAEHPQVSIVNDEARNFLRHSDQKFDIIQLSLVDSWAAQLGSAYSLSENNAYTVEAFADYLRRLAPGGILSVSRWTQEKHRLVALAAESLRRIGVSKVGEHLALFELPTDRVVTLLVSPQPLAKFGAAAGEAGLRLDRRTIASLQRRFDFRAVISPLRPPRDPVLAALLGSGGASDQKAAARDRKLGPAPPTDDRPFYFFPRTVSFTDLLRPFAALRAWNNKDFLNEAVGILGGLLIFTTLLSFSIVGVSLLGSRRLRAAARRVPDQFIYFGGIGLGFFFIECSQLQRFNIVVGHPFYGTTLVLSTLIGAAGLGSLASSRWQRLFGVRPMLLFSLAVIIGYGLLSGFAVSLVVDHGFFATVAVSLLLLAVLGIALGVWFPTGVAAVSAGEAPDSLPWLWMVNGLAAVLGSVYTIAFAINYGISGVFWLGLAAYTIAALTLRKPGSAANAAEAHLAVGEKGDFER